MSDRLQQLRENDVRDSSGAAKLDPVSFLSLYLASNFPQTAAIPSKEQLAAGVYPNVNPVGVDLAKKPLSGTSFDNPAAG